MNRNYLPSKLFIIRVVALISLIGLFFGVSRLIKYVNNKPDSEKPTGLVAVSDLIQKDSNDNGIPDWEEYLWGLDPNKNGPENKEYILAKKKSLSQSGQISDDNSGPLTQNEALSRQFFAAIVSLQQTGALDDESMKSLSEAIGKNVETIEIKDTYDNSYMTITEDSQTSKSNYRNSLSKLAKNYSNSDIGSELTIIIQGFNNKDPSALYAAKSIGEAYVKFGQEMIKIPTPRSVVDAHLRASNNYIKSGQAIINMTKGLSDPIIGMSAILSYKKYNDELSTNLDKISIFLQ